MISGVEAQGVAAAEQKEWTVAAMYCGCGGESLGCRNAGAKVLCAVDDDEHALKTYGANFPGTQLIRGDLLDDTLRARLIEDWRGRVDVVVGGPPCQPFSIANEHSEEPHYDEMKKHIVSYVKLALALEPRAVIMEVVPKAHKVLPEVRAHFEEAGYAVWHNKLPASKYGVPQERERLIVVACKGERAFVPPSPTTDPPETAGKALARAPVPAKGRPLQGFVRLECVPATTNLNKLAETQRRDRKTFGRENYKVMDLDKPANTITTETWSNTGCFFIQRGNLYHELSVEEAARLQSFPPDFKFMGCETNVRAQIGNAWPPEFARRIMLSLRDMLFDAPPDDEAPPPAAPSPAPAVASDLLDLDAEDAAGPQADAEDRPPAGEGGLKRKRKKASGAQRAKKKAGKKAEEEDGGFTDKGRVAFKAEGGVLVTGGKRTCLPDALYMLLLSLSIPVDVEEVRTIMPADPSENTLFMAADNFVSQFGLTLQRVTSRFMSAKGGVALALLQASGYFVVQLRITAGKDDKDPDLHCVAYDGATVRDNYQWSKVKDLDEGDRASPASARKVFNSLFHRDLEVRIKNVYELMPL